jgi:hypothetical protein
MQRLMMPVALVAALVIPGTARAQSGHAEVQGFGGITVGTSTFGSAAAPTFGGRVAVDLTPNIQAIGEGGRLADIKSPLFDLLDFTSVGVRVSAWYGEGGIRFIASLHSNVRPYAEATAGFARLNAGVSGLSGPTGAIVDAALNALNRSQPMLGVGGGVQLGRGPVTVDAGYRFKKISAGNTIASALNAGKDFQINQVRIGLGIRF